MLQRFIASVLFIAAGASNLVAQGLGQQGQGQPAIMKQEQLTVRVTGDDDQPAPPRLTVQLLSISGSSVDIRTTDGTGTVRFERLVPAKYKVRVSGDGILTADLDDIDMTDSGANLTQYVRVHRTAGNVDTLGVPTVDLKIPPEARKEFDKASEKMEQKNWTEAKTHLDRAISIYPKYALAYNSLAMVYVNLNQGEKAVESFRTATELDEHMQQANLYLGHFYYDNKNYKQAEPYLLRASGGEPRNAQLLLALANTQMQNGEADPALANAQKVHSLPDHKKFAVAHLIAAQILSDRGDTQHSREEFQLFLREAPDSPMAPRVKEALAKLDAAPK